MSDYSLAPQIKEAVAAASKIVIVQADNPDSDSLSSAMALDEILSDLNKEVILYCGVDLPSYLNYIPGGDRVVSELPKQFDLSIIVDTASDTLLEQLNKNGSKNWLAAKPAIIIDHHATQATISFAKIVLIEQAVSTTEIIYELAGQLNWSLNERARELIAIGILSDSLGLTTDATTARSIHIIAELVEQGVKLAQLEDARRQSMRREPELIHYKGKLLQRVEFHDGGRIATVTIPHEEINEFSPLYNPPMLVLDDMRLAKNTQVAIAFKTYNDGKITGKIRSNYGYGISDKLAEHFGGGGHPYAAGFKVTTGKNYAELKREVLDLTIELLDRLANETV
jgi:phosphoesterase RecJ-like protein